MEATEDYRYYPPKPEIIEKESASVLKTVVSLALFVVCFLFFDVDLNIIFLVALILFIHEMGHFIAMKYFGYRDVGMFFIPFLGAVVSGKKDEVSQKQKAIITLAGPVPGVLLGAGMIFWSESIENPTLYIYGILFMLINSINLIPVTPLDGGRLFEVFFFSFSDQVRAVFSVVSSIALLLIGFFFQFYVLGILGMFLLFRSQNSFKLIALQKKLAALKLNLKTSYKNLSDKDYFLIRKEYVKSAKLENIMDANAEFYGDNEMVLANAIRNLLKVPEKRDLNLGLKLLLLSLWIVSIAIAAFCMTPAISAFLNNMN